MALRNYLYAKHSNDGVTAARINKIDPNNSKNELIEQTIESFHSHQRQLNHQNHAKASSPESKSNKKIKVVHGQHKMKRTNLQFYQSNDSLNDNHQPSVSSSSCHSSVNNSHDNIEMEDATTPSANEKCRNCPDCKSKIRSEPLSPTTSPLTLTKSISPTDSMDHHSLTDTTAKVLVEYPHSSEYSTTTMSDLQSKIKSLSIDQSTEIDFTNTI